MAESADEIVDTTQEYGKAAARGRLDYFPSTEELAKQRWDEICTELNDVVSVMGKRFKVCKDRNDKSDLYLRIDCEGMRRKTVSDFNAELRRCGLDTQRDFQPMNQNMSFLGPDSGYSFIMVTGLRKGKTFKISPELQTFAESHPPKRSACCNIL